MYKNPKKPKVSATASGVNGDEDGDGELLMAGKGKGPSAMQPAASALEGVKLVKGGVGNEGGGLLVNEKAFLRRRREDVPVDQVGFVLFLLSCPFSLSMTDGFFFFFEPK